MIERGVRGINHGIGGAEPRNRQTFLALKNVTNGAMKIWLLFFFSFIGNMKYCVMIVLGIFLQWKNVSANIRNPFPLVNTQTAEIIWFVSGRGPKLLISQRNLQEDFIIYKVEMTMEGKWKRVDWAEWLMNKLLLRRIVSLKEVSFDIKTFKSSNRVTSNQHVFLWCH